MKSESARRDGQWSVPICDRKEISSHNLGRTEGTKMKVFVYILFSEKFRKTYDGQTSDIEKRITMHNAGESNSQKIYAPWKLIHSEEFDSRVKLCNGRMV